MRETGDEESPAERLKVQAKVSGSEGYRCVVAVPVLLRRARDDGPLPGSGVIAVTYRYTTFR